MAGSGLRTPTSLESTITSNQLDRELLAATCREPAMLFVQMASL